MKCEMKASVRHHIKDIESTTQERSEQISIHENTDIYIHVYGLVWFIVLKVPGIHSVTKRNYF